MRPELPSYLSSADLDVAGLRRTILNAFNDEELQTLCFDLSIDYDSLPAVGKEGKVRELVAYCQRVEQLQPLLVRCERLRPTSPWLALLRVGGDSASSPFKGLHYFDEADSHLFFGREHLTAQLVCHLHQRRFLAVVGASGSGKSSVVRAGMIPFLRRGETVAMSDGTRPPDGSADWPIHIIIPDAHPLKALATSLSHDTDSVKMSETMMADLATSPHSLDLWVTKLLQRRGKGKRLVIVVDQFEELFTASRDEAARKAFIENLLHATAPETAGPTIVIITLRADFYAHCAQYANLREALSQDQIYIGAMNAAELRQAIERPAVRAGLELEPGLVEQLLRDIGAAGSDSQQPEPGALPLLSHALLETWRRRRGQTMTLQGYHEAGRVQGAIAQTAETIYKERLTADQQTIARSIFLRLTELGEGTQDTRRRAALDELMPHPADREKVADVLELLVDARLITTGEGVAEVAHEALIREWPALRHWLDENRDGLRLHRQLAEDACEWEELGHDPGALYRGTRWAQVTEWAADHEADLNERERAFLAASQAEGDRQQQAEAERRRKEEQLAVEQRSARRLRWLSYGLALVFGIAVLFAILAATQRQAAEGNEQLALTRQAEAEQQSTVAFYARSTAEVAATHADVSLVTAQAAEAQQATEAFQADLARATAEAARDLAATAQAETDRLNDFIRVNQLAAEAQLAREQQQPRRSLLLALESLYLAQQGEDDWLPIAETALRQSLTVNGGRGLTGHQAPVIAAAFSPDPGGYRGWLATLSLDDTIRLWDTAASNPSAAPLILPLNWHILQDEQSVPPQVQMHFSSDGRWLVVADGELGWLARWDMEAANPADSQFVFPWAGGEQTRLDGFALSQDGRWLAADQNGMVRVWSLEEGEVREPAYTFSRAQDSDPEVPHYLLFDNSGRWLVNQTFNWLYLWDLTAADPDANRVEQPLDFAAVDYPPAMNADGRWLAVGSGSAGAVELWDMAAPDAPAVTASLGMPARAYFSPNPANNGEWLVTAGEPYLTFLWDLEAADPFGQPVRQLVGEDIPNEYTTNSHSLLLSPQGRWLLTGGQRYSLWDLTTPASPPLILDAYQGATFSFSPDERWLAAYFPDGHPVSATGSSNAIFAEFDGNVYLWDLEATGTVAPVALVGHETTVTALHFSRDNRWIATASDDGTIRLWSMPTAFEAAAPVHLNEPGGEIRSSSTTVVEDVLYNFASQIIPDVVAASPDGRWLAATEERELFLWDLSNPDPASTAVLVGDYDLFSTRAYFDANSRWLVYWKFGTSAALALWDLSVPMTAGSGPSLYLGGEELGMAVEAVALSNDGRWLLAGLGLEWPDTKLEFLSDPAGATETICGFAPLAWPSSIPGGLLGGGSGGGGGGGGGFGTDSPTYHILVWDLHAPDPATARISLRGHQDSIRQVTISADNRWVGSISADNTARLWDMAATDPSATAFILEGHQEAITNLDFSPDSSQLVSRSIDSTRLWKLAVEGQGQVLSGHEQTVTTVLFSPDSRWLLTRSLYHAQLWDKDGRSYFSIILPSSSDSGQYEQRAPLVGTTLISNDSRWLVILHQGWGWLWDLTVTDPAASQQPLVEYDQIVLKVTISPNNQWLVVSSYDQPALLMDLKAPNPLSAPTRLTGQQSVSEIAVSHNSRWLVTLTPEGKACLWDLAADEPAARAFLFSDYGIDSILRSRFSGDDRWLILETHQGLYLWPLRLDDVVDIACQTVGRNLTQDEWGQYFPGQAYRRTCPTLPPGLGTIDQGM